MKKIFVILMLTTATFSNQFSFAQNLVPNPSFEDTVSCPNMGGQVARARYWHTLDNTPDYFHECCIYPQFSVPSNRFGYQYAATGEAYCGFFTISFGPIGQNYREIIGCYLLSPLVVGTKYFVTFKLNFTDVFQGPSHAATNKTGILFSTTDYLTSPPPINNYSQVKTDSIISDTTIWSTVRGSFIADSAYTFISIGNFFDDAHTDTLLLDGATDAQGYYFVDDICVSTDSIFAEHWSNLPKDEIEENVQIFPNPVYQILSMKNIPFDAIEVEIISVDGILFKSTNINRKRIVNIDISALSSGLYTAIIKSKNGNYKVRKFIKSN